MAKTEHLDKLKQGVDAWNQWRQNYPDIQPDLSEAHLEGVHLSGIHLEGADLHGAHLEESHLGILKHKPSEFSELVDIDEMSTGTAFMTVLAEFNDETSKGILGSAAQFFGIDPEKIDLKQIFLSPSHLEGANLTRANLAGADFSGVHLERANLSKAHLEKTNW